MEWKHNVSLDWLNARKEFLTATDIVSLVPVTKTGRPRKIDDADYLKVWGKKQARSRQEDCLSTGVMARGHILEPYAIDTFNKTYANCFNIELFHWDDTVVTEHCDRALAFSPDAMDVPFIPGNVIRYMDDVRYIGEVKSYSPDRHMLCGYTPAKQLEERWQIAAAMAACPSIAYAYLIFFNPSVKQEMFVVEFDRHLLADEIDMCLKVEEDWKAFLDNFDFAVGPNWFSSVSYDHEQDIIEDLEKKDRLNPVKKVIK